MSSTKEQIEVIVQINQSIKDRLILLDESIEIQRSQLEACRHLYEQMSSLHDDVVLTEKRIDGLTPPKPESGTFNSLLDSLGKISETSEKNKGFFSHLADVFKSLAKAASGIALIGFSALGNFFKGIYSIFKTLLSVIPDLGKILFNILVELFKVVVSLYDKLIDMANEAFSGGGSSDYYAALQKLKEQYGALDQNTPSSIISMSTKMKAIKDVGLSPFRIFGNRGIMIQEFLDQYATKMGPLFEFYANEFDVTEGALLGMIKGMGLSGEDVEGMSREAISKGRSLSEEFIENHKIVSKIAKPFTEASKLIHRDIAKATRNIKSFGGASKEAIGAAASFARSIGLNINDLTGIMDTFKDFDTALETATKYYEIYQIKIDTYKMFEEQDLGSMLKHLRDGFKTAGVETTSLNRAYISLLSSTSGLDDAVAIQALSINNTSADFDDIKHKASEATTGTKTLERSLYELRDYIEYKPLSGGGFKADGFFDAWIKGLERAIFLNPHIRGLLRDIWTSLKIFYREGTRLFQEIFNAFPGLVDFVQAARRFFDPKRFSILIKGINNSFISLFKGVKTNAYTVDRFFKDVGELFENHFKDFIKVDDGRLLKSLKKTFNSTLVIISMMIDAIGKLLADGIKFLAAVISGNFDFSSELKKVFNETMKGFDKVFQPVASAIEKTIKRIGLAIASLKETIMNLFKTSSAYDKGMTFFQKIFSTIMTVKNKIVIVVNKVIDTIEEYWKLLVDLVIPVFSFITDLFSMYSIFLWGLIVSYFGKNMIQRWRGKTSPKYRFKQGKVPSSIRSDSTVKMKDVFKSRKNARLIRGFISSNQVNFSNEANQIFKKMTGYDANKSFGMSERKLKLNKLNLQDLTAAEYQALRGGRGLEIYEELKRKGAPDEILKSWEPFKEVSQIDVEKIEPKKSLSARALDKIKGTRVGQSIGKAYGGVRDWTRGKANNIKSRWNNSWVGKGLANTVGTVNRAVTPLVNISKSIATKVSNIPGARPVGKVLKFGGGLVGGIVIGLGLGWIIDKLIMGENGEIKKDENGNPVVSESTFKLFSGAMTGLQIWALATPLGWIAEATLFVGGFFSDTMKGMSLFHSLKEKISEKSSIDIVRDEIIKNISENISSEISKNPESFLTINSFTKKWEINSIIDNQLTSDDFWKQISEVWLSNVEIMTPSQKAADQINSLPREKFDKRVSAKDLYAGNKKIIEGNRDSFIDLVVERIRPSIDQLYELANHKNKLLEEEERETKPEKTLQEEQEEKEKALIAEENKRFDETGRSSFFEAFKKMISKSFEIIINLKSTISSYISPIKSLEAHIAQNPINNEKFYTQIEDFQNIGQIFSDILSKSFENTVKYLSAQPLSKKLEFFSSALLQASKIPEKTSFIDFDLKKSINQLRDALNNISRIQEILIGVVDGFTDFEKNDFQAISKIFPWIKKKFFIFADYLSVDLSAIPKIFEQFDDIIINSLKYFPPQIFSQMKIMSLWAESILVLLSLKDSLNELSQINFPASVLKDHNVKPESNINLDFTPFEKIPLILKKISNVDTGFNQSFKDKILGLNLINVSIPSFKLYEEGVARFSRIIELSDWFKENDDKIIISNLEDLQYAANFFLNVFVPKVIKSWTEEKYQKLFLKEFTRRIVDSIKAFNNAYSEIRAWLADNPLKVPVHLRNEEEIFNGRSGVVTLDGPHVKISCDYKVSFHDGNKAHTRQTLEREIYLNKKSRVKDRLLYWSSNGTQCKLPYESGYDSPQFDQARDYLYFGTQWLGCNPNMSQIPVEAPTGESTYDDQMSTETHQGYVSGGGALHSPSSSPTADGAAAAAIRLIQANNQRAVQENIDNLVKKLNQIRESPSEPTRAMGPNLKNSPSASKVGDAFK